MRVFLGILFKDRVHQLSEEKDWSVKGLVYKPSLPFKDRLRVRERSIGDIRGGSKRGNPDVGGQVV